MALRRRIVVVGLGSIGRRHARLLQARDELAVEWCEASTEAVAFARGEGLASAAVHADFAAMLATGPEMIVIATPHAAHAAQAISALDRGIHVLCEKPMSDTLEAAQRMAAAAARSAATFTVGFQLHFHPAMQRAKELIGQGALGSVHHVHCLVGTYVTLVNSKSRYQESLYGALLMDYAHQPDILHFLTGDIPRGVYAAGGQGGSLPLQSNPNFAALTCDYAAPFISTILLNYLQAPDRHEYEIIGDQGWLSIDLFKGRMRIGSQRDNSERTEEFSTERDALYVREHDAFFDAIAGRRLAESPAADALVSMRVIDAALRSLKSQSRIPVGSPQNSS